MFTSRQLLKKYKKIPESTQLLFIDLEKANVTVSWKKLWIAGIDLIKIIRYIQRDSTYQIKMRNKLIF